jgi:hypothetical protein
MNLIHSVIEYAIPIVLGIRQNNRFWRVTRNRYKLPKIQIFGGKDAIQQRRKSQMGGRLAAGRKDRMGLCEGKRAGTPDVYKLDEIKE